MTSTNPLEPPPAARFVGAAVSFIFAAIGVTVLVFLWSAPFDEFHSPPLFFRVFGSFIALVFVIVGGAGGVAALKGGRPAPFSTGRPKPDDAPAPTAGPTGGYKCPHCGAPLGTNADVSPSGDAKCAFCGRWFNIHKAG